MRSPRLPAPKQHHQHTRAAAAAAAAVIAARGRERNSWEGRIVVREQIHLRTVCLYVYFPLPFSGVLFHCNCLWSLLVLTGLKALRGWCGKGKCLHLGGAGRCEVLFGVGDEYEKVRYFKQAFYMCFATICQMATCFFYIEQHVLYCTNRDLQSCLSQRALICLVILHSQQLLASTCRPASN